MMSSRLSPSLDINLNCQTNDFYLMFSSLFTNLDHNFDALKITNCLDD